jgi:hypothetical protein
MFVATFTHPHIARAGIDDTGIDTANGETATTSPKTRTVNVTATVPNNNPPSVPILISPDNGSKSSTTIVTFIWHSSTDDFAMGKYQLFVDGSLLFDDLPPDAVKNTAQYSYKEINGIATLALKYALAEGDHTWKVRAYDNDNNRIDSATWSFTIDSTAPILTITGVGEVETSISAQDVNTIPVDPIEIYDSSPTISGYTESSATMQLSYVIPAGFSGAGTHILYVTAYTTGLYQFNLPVLPPSAVIRFQILSRDSVGNSTIIDNVPFMIKRRIIYVPGILTPPLPPEIPIIPVEEVRQEIVNIVRPYVPEPVVDIVDTVTPYANSALGFAIPLARLFAALWLIGIPVWNISVRTLLRTAHSVGLWPFFWLPPIPHHAQGIVFDLETQKPIAFALISIMRMDPNGPVVIDQRVSNRYGTYETVRLPATGSYILVPKHRDYLFDREAALKRFSTAHEVYTGNPISKDVCAIGDHGLNAIDDGGIECVDNQILAHLYIPMVQQKHSKSEALANTTAKLPDNGLGISTAVMAVIAFFSPTPWNIAVLILYAISLTRRVFFS